MTQNFFIIFSFFFFFFFKAPLILRLLLIIILITTTFISINLRLSLIPYIFIIVIVRGIIVIFSYLASFVLNEWLIQINYFINFIFILITIILLIIFNNFFFFEYLTIKKLEITIYYLYTNFFGFFSLFLISYLYLVLLVVIKISNNYKVPLRLMK